MLSGVLQTAEMFSKGKSDINIETANIMDNTFLEIEFFFTFISSVNHCLPCAVTFFVYIFLHKKDPDCSGSLGRFLYTYFYSL